MITQVRTEDGEIKEFPTLEDAFCFATAFKTVWKISFSIETGERIRLIRENNQWIYEDIYGNRRAD